MLVTRWLLEGKTDLSHSPLSLLPCAGNECWIEPCVHVCMLQGKPAFKETEIWSKEEEECKFDLSWFMMVPDCCMFSSVHEALQGSNGEQLLVISSSTKVSRNWCWCGLLGKSCLILLLPHGLYPPSSSVHGISQIRILDRVVISVYRASSPLRDQTHVSCTGKHILYHWAAREAH